MTNCYIEKLSAATKKGAIDFLRRHEDYVIFLLGNLENEGIALTESPYSGNFKIIRQDKEIIGVFCLTRSGNLLLQTAPDEQLFSLILGACREESIPIRGVIGEWRLSISFWEWLKVQNVIGSETRIAKEVLYSVDISSISLEAPANVRFLAPEDYPQWRALELDYLAEEGLPCHLSEEEMRQLYLRGTKDKIHWGLFVDSELVAMAQLNAKAQDIGQVGGVYTAPDFRRLGYSKAIMRRLIHDCRALHNLRKLIIFTGIDNAPARRLYESLGVHQVGHFALLFT